MAGLRYTIPSDGSRIQLAPPFTIRNFQAFNQGTAALSIYDQMGTLIAVIGPGGYGSYNPNCYRLSAAFSVGGQGIGEVTVSDAAGPNQPASAPTVGQLVSAAGGATLIALGNDGALTKATQGVAAGTSLLAFVVSNNVTPAMSDSAGDSWHALGHVDGGGGSPPMLYLFKCDSSVGFAAGATFSSAGVVYALAVFACGPGLVVASTATSSTGGATSITAGPLATGSSANLYLAGGLAWNPANALTAGFPFSVLCVVSSSSGAVELTVASFAQVVVPAVSVQFGAPAATNFLGAVVGGFIASGAATPLPH